MRAIPVLALLLCPPFSGPPAAAAAPPATVAAVPPAAAAAPSASDAPSHPLDGLTPGEHWIVYDVLRASGRTDADTRVAGVALREPPKAEVLAWKPGSPFRREALVILKQKMKAVEAVVDIQARKVISWKEVPGAQPNLLPEEEQAVDGLVKKNPDVIAALKKRGIADLATIGCWSTTPGYFGLPEEEGRRVVKVSCTQIHGTYVGYGHPVEGLVVVVDLEERKVLRVIDTGVVPTPDGGGDYDDSVLGKRREPAPPLRLDQPQGPGFTLRGHEVSWQNWKFHFRVDPRRALVVSTVRYVDGDRERSILYQGSLSEIFVPYMDPSEGWYYLTYLDLGDYSGMGLVSSLEKGQDCPENAVYFDSIMPDEHGIPEPRPRSACLFERVSGDVAWRHWSGRRGSTQSRPRRDLVLRSILTAGNYDYILDWVFQQDGTLQVQVGATGIVAFKGVENRTFTLDGQGRPLPGGRDDLYGRYVADHTVAVNHDHFFCYRLDLDVDGTANSLVIDQLKSQRADSGTPRRSLWVVDSRTARVERDAQLHMSMEKPAVWRFVNPKERGPMGYPTSYEIRPGHAAMSLMAPDDSPQRRAGFIEHLLWVTPYRPEELFAAGDYTTQSRGGEGLPAWTAANRPIENTDIVAWYTIGFHHMVRAEDWPVTPTGWHGFELRPFDFFRRTPSLDLPDKP